MSYLDQLKLKKTSKLVKVFEDGKHPEFPDDIFVKPASKTYLIAWMANLKKFDNLTDADLLISKNIIGIERSFYQMILLSACTQDCTKLADAFDEAFIK